jgi:hypothetical protein
MKSHAHDFSDSRLVLLRPILIIWAYNSISDKATIASKFSVFLIESLSNADSLSLVVIDGYALKWTWKATYINIVRALAKNQTKTHFILCEDRNLSQFQLNLSNFEVCKTRLTKDNIFSELELLIESTRRTR